MTTAFPHVIFHIPTDKYTGLIIDLNKLTTQDVVLHHSEYVTGHVRVHGANPTQVRPLSTLQHSKGNVVSLIAFSSLAALKVLKMITFCAVSDEI